MAISTVLWLMGLLCHMSIYCDYMLHILWVIVRKAGMRNKTHFEKR